MSVSGSRPVKRASLNSPEGLSYERVGDAPRTFCILKPLKKTSVSVARALLDP